MFLTPPPFLGKLVPQEKLHPKTFDGANKNFKVIPWQKLDRFKRSKVNDVRVRLTFRPFLKTPFIQA